MKKIALFCASANNLPSSYTDMAQALGSWCAQNSVALLYGGANVGLMEAAATAAAAQQGKLIAIMPHYMVQRGKLAQVEQEVVSVETLSQRKALMMEEGDLFVALPGGIGTLDEIFDLLAAKQTGEQQKELILCNIDHFFDPLLCLFESLYQKGVSPEPYPQFCRVVESQEQLFETIKSIL